MEEDLILLEDSKDDSIEIDSEENEKFILTYDSISNKYIDKNGETYIIYERLHNTIEEIYDKYIQETNIVPDNKYLNSLHLFICLRLFSSFIEFKSIKDSSLLVSEENFLQLIKLTT